MHKILAQIGREFLSGITFEESITRGGNMSKTLTIIKDGKKVGSIKPAKGGLAKVNLRGSTPVVTDNHEDIEWRLRHA